MAMFRGVPKLQESFDCMSCSRGQSIDNTGVIFDDDQVLRQLDISTSRTIAIEVISGVGNVTGDIVQVSLWALGDQMLVKVWQEKVIQKAKSSIFLFENPPKNVTLGKIRENARHFFFFAQIIPPLTESFCYQLNRSARASFSWKPLY